MYLFFVITVFTCANNFYNLFSWGKVEGVFNTADVGIVFMLATGFFIFLFSREKKILANRFTGLILFQMLFCLFHILFVQVRFDYPPTQAVIASRSFLNYFSFFYFLLLLDTPQRIYRVMEVLNWIMIVILVLSVANYFHPFLYHEWAEGHYERAGVKRGFIPAMSVLSMLGIWSFANMFATAQMELKWRSYSFLYITAHIFRQTRMRIVGILFTLFCLAIYKRNFNSFFLALVIVIIGAVSINTFLNTNVLYGNIAVTLEEVSTESGSLGGRFIFAESIWEEMKKSPLAPLVGTGGSAIRPYQKAYKAISDKQFYQYYILGKQSDFGYLNWIKNFGIIGVVWLVSFFYSGWKYFRNATSRKRENEDLALFSGFYLIFVAGTSLTLEHFVVTDKIIPVMLSTAILVRLNFGWREVQ